MDNIILYKSASTVDALNGETQQTSEEDEQEAQAFDYGKYILVRISFLLSQISSMQVPCPLFFLFCFLFFFKRILK